MEVRNLNPAKFVWCFGVRLDDQGTHWFTSRDKRLFSLPNIGSVLGPIQLLMNS